MKATRTIEYVATGLLLSQALIYLSKRIDGAPNGDDAHRARMALPYVAMPTVFAISALFVQPGDSRSALEDAAAGAGAASLTEALRRALF